MGRKGSPELLDLVALGWNRNPPSWRTDERYPRLKSANELFGMRVSPLTQIADKDARSELLEYPSAGLNSYNAP